MPYVPRDKNRLPGIPTTVKGTLSFNLQNTCYRRQHVPAAILPRVHAPLPDLLLLYTPNTTRERKCMISPPHPHTDLPPLVSAATAPFLHCLDPKYNRTHRYHARKRTLWHSLLDAPCTPGRAACWHAVILHVRCTCQQWGQTCA